MLLFKNHYRPNGIMKRTMANSLMTPVALEVTSKNLRPTMRMVWLVFSRLVINPSIQMGGWSLSLPINILMHGKRLYLLLYVQVLSSMGAGPFRRRWETGLVRSHRLRWHPLSG